MFPENLHLVPDGGIRVRDINHAVSMQMLPMIGTLFPLTNTLPTRWSSDGSAVGIPTGITAIRGRAGGVTFAPVPDGLAFRNLTDGRDVGLETTYRLEVGVRGTDSV